MEEKDYSFNLLKDEAVNIDSFIDKTHERIAKTLYQIISNDNSDGVTIGLEGPWGSGKSTIISILKENLEKKKFHYFYFDAWAHEGDPLRRIFLKSIIKQFYKEKKYKKLNEIDDEISNPIQNKKIKSKQSVTVLGKLVAISSLLIPLGVAFISISGFTNLSLKVNGKLNIIAFFGIILTLLPIIILGINWTLHFFWKIGNIIFNGIQFFKNIFREDKKEGIAHHRILEQKHWQFISGENNIEIIEEVLGEDRTSIEFEEYFNSILKILLPDGGNEKLIIVIDNLDRIDSEDSLKIWATLQTFLQQRNPTDLENQLYKKIWILVPYDQHGLEKLWQIDKKYDDKNDNGKNSHINCAQSFFEKCFQLRLDVPKPILTGWETFAKEKINEALIALPENEKEDILSVLRNTRDNLADIPTPRQIKTYVNQVGLLRMQAAPDIPTQSIAYYVIFKYINKNIDSDKIRENILKKELPRENDTYFLHADCDKHLAGLVFGVGSIKGQQLLLEPIIENALKSGKGESLKAILEKHDEGFWSVFQYHITQIPDIRSLLPYSITVYDSIWGTNKNRCSDFIQRLQNLPLSFPNKNSILFYIPLIKMLIETNNSIENIWLPIIQDLEKNFSKDGFDVSLSVDLLSQLIESFGNRQLKRFTIDVSNVKTWQQWAIESAKKELELYRWVSPPESFKDDLAKTIIQGQLIADDILKAHKYSLNAGLKGWIQFATACVNHIKSNNVTPSVNGHSEQVISVLQELLFIDDSVKDVFANLIKTGEFHNFVHHQQAEGSVLYSSIMMAYFLGNELHTITIPPIANSAKGVQLIRDFWVTKSPDNAEKVWSILSKHKQYSLVWSMAENSKNKLLEDLIPLGIKNDTRNFFSLQDSLNKLQNTIAIIEDKYKMEIVQCFIDHSNILDEVREIENLDVIKYYQELYLIVDMVDNIENFKTNIISKLVKITKEEWIQAFNNYTYLLSLIIAVKEKNQKFILENNYFDGILDYACRWIKGEIEPTEWIIKNWLALIKLLKSSFQTHFNNKITEIIWQNLMELQFKTFKSFKELLDVKNTINGKIHIMQEFLETILQSEIDFDKLKLVDIILSKDKKHRFKPEDHFPDVINIPLNALYKSENVNEEHKDLIFRIAERFHVSIEDMNESNEKENNDSSVEANVEGKT